MTDQFFDQPILNSPYEYPSRLHLVVEIKGYRREDAKEKKTTMETCWVPGVNRVGAFARGEFTEFGNVYEMEADFEARVLAEFDRMLESVAATRKEAKT